jgi:hypothetical protein
MSAAGFAHASVVSYNVFVNTSGISAGPGYIDVEFNQALSGVSGSAIVTDFQSTGFGFDVTPIFTTGVTGSFAAPPLSIPNDQSGINYYREPVTTWGQYFSFVVTLDTAATDSGFYLYLLDSSYNSIVGPLDSGEVANIIIDSNGVATAQSSTFEGGNADISEVPEPASAWLLAPGLGALLMGFRRRRSA